MIKYTLMGLDVNMETKLHRNAHHNNGMPLLTPPCMVAVVRFKSVGVYNQRLVQWINDK